MAKKNFPDLTVQEVGTYLFDAGFFLDQFHGTGFQEAGEVAEGIGLGLETGEGTFGPIPFPIPQADGVWLLDAGMVIGQFNTPGMKAAGSILDELGIAVTAGKGSVGPIRIGSESVSFAISGGQLTGTIGPWQG